jgi:hypothetical protein
MKKSELLPVAAFACLLQGCAGLPDTADQIISIRTSPPVESTHCIVSNSLGSWNIWTTPGTLSILRDTRPLIVECRSPKGMHGELVLRANNDIVVAIDGQSTNKVAEMSNAGPPPYDYIGNTAGKWNGTFRQYPNTIVVPMKPDRS